MLEPHGVNYDDVRNEPVINGEEWYSYFTMTPEEDATFRKWAIDRIRKVMKCSIASAERDFDWFWLAYGLRVDDSNNVTSE